MSNDDVFITKSTVENKETTKIDGVEYPLFKLEILELLTHIIQVNLN